jgi:hypothetical protein
MANDSRRWLDTDLPDELQAVLSSAREDGVHPAQVANLRASLEHAIGPAAFSMREPAGSASAASSGSSQTVATKLFGASHSGLGAAAWGVGSIVALGLVAIAARVVWPAHESSSSISGPPKIASAVDPSSQPWAADAMPPPAAGVAPAVSAPKAATEAIRPAARDAAPSMKSRARDRAMLRARDRDANAAGAELKPQAAATLAEELRSLAQIRSEMQNPARALAAVERHAKRFTAGALIPERELLELEALLKLGQTARARRVAARLTSGPGPHPYRAQAMQLVAEYGSAGQ